MVFGSARTYCTTFGRSRPVQCARISSPLYSFLSFSSYICTDHSHPGDPPVTPVNVVVVFVVIVVFVFLVFVVVSAIAVVII